MVAALRAALVVSRSAAAAPSGPQTAPSAEVQPCIDQQLATGTEVLGVAEVGTAVVVVLTLRAMGEWRTIQATRPPTDATPGGGAVRKPPRVR